MMLRASAVGFAWAIEGHIRYELPDEESERAVFNNNNDSEEKKQSFEEIFSKLKLPYKLTHPDRLEESKEFMRHRLKAYPPGTVMPALKLEDYAELYEALEEGGEEREQRVNAIQLVIDYYNRILAKSIFAPSAVPLDDMKKMLTSYGSLGPRIRYLHFLFVREFDVWRRERLDEASRQEHLRLEAEELATFSQIGVFKSEEERAKENETPELQYGFWRNTLFTRYFGKGVARQSLHRLRVAEQFGQPLVVDCSFDETMADYETISVSRQISAIYHLNRYAPRGVEPFRLLFTGYREENRGYRHASRQLADVLADPAYCFNLRPEPYEQLLGRTEEDRARLVYLSPDARQLMTTFDPTAVYIVGALVSKTHKSSLTWEKAREQGIQCLRLPIHNYLELKPGVKRVLSFQGVFRILLEMKWHGDWERALRAGILPHKIKDGGGGSPQWRPVSPSGGGRHSGLNLPVLTRTPRMPTSWAPFTSPIRSSPTISTSSGLKVGAIDGSAEVPKEANAALKYAAEGLPMTSDWTSAAYSSAVV
ncbi:tRNA methyltransferase 10 C [Tyrophagus putrescentiae]|nr:tRNA methyltransferase 10 C [Tyrophagus putrescentiae]